MPEAGQASNFAGIEGTETVAVHASPYAANPIPALHTAAAALSGTDMIVTHCIGYTEAMRRELMSVSGRPVLLSRRVVAYAIDLLLT
jgi:protein AroM